MGTDGRRPYCTRSAGPKRRSNASTTPIALDPFFPSMLLYFRAQAVYQLGRYHEAVALLKRRILRNPETDGSRALLAAGYGQMGLVEEARAAWRELCASAQTFRSSIAAKCNLTRTRTTSSGLSKACIRPDCRSHDRRPQASRDSIAADDARRFRPSRPCQGIRRRAPSGYVLPAQLRSTTQAPPAASRRAQIFRASARDCAGRRTRKNGRKPRLMSGAPRMKGSMPPITLA